MPLDPQAKTIIDLIDSTGAFALTPETPPQELRQRYPGRAVLVLSMYPEDRYAVRALKAGAAGYLTKESAPEELVSAIRKVQSEIGMPASVISIAMALPCLAAALRRYVPISQATSASKRSNCSLSSCSAIRAKSLA